MQAITPRSGNLRTLGRGGCQTGVVQTPPPPEAHGSELRPSTGVGVLHLFCRASPDFDVPRGIAAVEGSVGSGMQVVTVAMLGHRGDVGFMAIAADLWALRDFQTRVQHAGLDPVDSYVSLTEVSEYSDGVPDEIKQARLYPTLPPEGKEAFCFYPMSKRRSSAQNWYALDYEKRKELMFGHGAVGRKFRGRVLQVVTGSTGLDDYEWGVTLFGVHPDDLKECVYQMRFDEASAQYADFGPFFTGMVGTPAEVLGRATGS